MSRFTDSVEENLRGCDAFSVGSCPGCAECGLADLTEECPHCEDGTCMLCDDDGNVPREPTEEERELADEPHFSWRKCRSCGSSFGGDRHPAHYMLDGWRDLPREERVIHHVDVCTDCLFYHANGDEPEGWKQSPDDPDPEERA